MKTPKPGYSLVEVTITLALIVSIMTGVIQTMAQASKVKRKVDQLNWLTFYMINFLEDLRSSDLSQVKFLIENQNEIIDPTSGEKFSCQWQIIPESPQAYRVEVQVKSEAHREKKLEVTLWLLPLLGF